MTRKRWFIGGGLAVLALAAALSVGTVFAASPATPASGAQTAMQTFVDRLAQNLGLSSDKVTQGLQATETQTINDEVASGKLTPAQGDALKQQIASGQLTPFMFGGHDMGMGGPRGHFGDENNVVASTLGMTQQQLHDALSSGKTMVQVISDQGKTVADVVNAVVAQEKTELDQAATNGKITQAQETQQLDTLKTDVTNAINNNTFGQGGRGWFGGHGPMNGSPMNGSQSQSPAPTN